MKKILLMISLSLIALFLIACDGTGITTDNLTLPNITTGTQLPTTEDISDEPATEIPTTSEHPTQEPTTYESSTGEPTSVHTEEDTVVPTNEPTNDSTLSGQLDVVTGLNINQSTKVLSWIGVQGAIGYDIYVDGEFFIHVSTTSYDFSSMTADSILFSIVAKAPSGLSDSAMSSTIAYMGDKASQIQAMILVLNSSPMDFHDSEAFATELVSKGMTADDMDEMMTQIMSLEQISFDDFNDFFAFIDGIIESMDRYMIEAFLSALIKVELPVLLQEQLDYYMELHGQEYYYDEYYDKSLVYDYSEDIHMIESLLLFLESHSDQSVQTIMVFIDYLMAVEASINQDMITDLEDIIMTGPFEELSIMLIVSLKNELVNDLIINLPTLEEMVLVNTTMMAFIDVLSEGEIDLSMISVVDQAQQELMILELMFNFLLEIDQDYIRAFAQAAMGANILDAKEFIKQNFYAFDRFMNNNQILLDSLDASMSSDLLEEIFIEMIFIPLMIEEYYSYTYDGEYDPEVEEEIALLVREYIDFSDILLFGDSLKDSMELIFDTLIENDLAIVDDFIELMMLEQGGSNVVAHNDDFDDINFYINVLLEAGNYDLVVRGYDDIDHGEIVIYVYAGGYLLNEDPVYLNQGQELVIPLTLTSKMNVEFYTSGEVDTVGTIISTDSQVRTRAQIQASLINGIIDLVNPVIQNVTIEEYQALIDIIFANVYLQMEIVSLTGNDFTDYMRTAQFVEMAIRNTMENQINIIQNTINVLDDTTFIDDLMSMYETYFEDELGYYGLAIIYANLVDDVYSANQVDIDVLIEEFITTISDPEMMLLLMLNEDDILNIENVINSYINDLTTQAKYIKDYDYQLITETQMLDVEEFIRILEELGIYIEIPSQVKGYEPGVVLSEIEIFVPYEVQDFYQMIAYDYIEAYNNDPQNQYLYPHDIYVYGVDNYELIDKEYYSEGGPDIFAIPQPLLGGMVAEMDLISPIQSQELIDYMLNFLDDDLVEDTLYDGEFYGVPYSMESLFLYYDKRILSEEDVLSWEGIWAKSQALGVNASAITSPDSYNNSFLILASYLDSGQMPVTLFQDGINTNTDFVNDASISVMKWGQRIFSDTYGIQNFSPSSAIYKMQNQELLSFIGGPWHMNDVYATMGENLGIAVLPTFTLTEEDVYGSVQAGTQMKSGAFTDGKVFVKNQYSYESEYLDDLLAYFVSYEVQEIAVAYDNITPTYKYANDEFYTLSHDDIWVQMLRTQVDMLKQGVPQPFDTKETNISLYYNSGTDDILFFLLSLDHIVNTDELIIENMQDMEDIWTSHETSNNLDGFYITGNFAGWSDSFSNPDYQMIPTASDNPLFAGMNPIIQTASEIYIIDVMIPSEDAGWSEFYNIGGTSYEFNGNLTVKFAYVQDYSGTMVPNYWAPSPESGVVYNLTPESLYIPDYVDDYNNPGGNWNSNPALFESGRYIMVVAVIEGELWFGAIEKEVSQPVEGAIVIGNTVPTTGAFAMVGLPFNQGLLAVIDYYNTHLTGDELPIVFSHYDDQFDPELALTYLDNLRTIDDVFAVVGLLGTPTVNYTYQFFLENNIPLIFPFSPSDLVYNEYSMNNPIIPVQPITYTEGRFMALRALTTSIYGLNQDQAFPSDGKIVIMFSEDENTGYPTMFGIADQLDQLGINWDNVYFLPVNSGNVEAQLSTIESFNADVILTGLDYQTFNDAMVAMDNLGISIPVFASSANTNSYFLGLNYSPQRPIYNNAWLNIDTTSNEYLEYVQMINSATIFDETTKQSLLGNPYSIYGYIAGLTLIEGLYRVQDNDLDITVENFIAMMESMPINIPMAGDLDLSNGSRIGANSMSLIQYKVGDNPNTVEIETDAIYWVLIEDYVDIYDLQAELVE